MYSQRVRVLIFLTMLMTAGCGGGGGGSGNRPSVSIDKTTVAVSATVTDASVGTPTVTLTVSNAPSQGIYIAGGTTKNGVSALSAGNFSGAMAVIQIFLKTPYTLAPATYTDTVTLEACLDQACAQQIAGSPLNVTVTYTINPAPAGSAPAISVSQTTLFAQALPTGSAPLAGVQVSIVNAPGFSLTAQVTSTNSGVTSVDGPGPTWNAPPQVGFDVTINFKPPDQLSAGVYTDQLTIEVCLDPACVNQLEGSPKTVTITYQIGNGVSGSYSVNEVPVQAADLAVDNQHSLLYAAVSASAPANASSVAIIDPATATVTSYIPTSFDPGKLAVSDDGSYLYVGENNGPHIARFLLPAMTLDATIVLPNDAHGSVTWPIDIKVQPGSPKTIAVARDFQNDRAIQGDGVVIYDDTTPRPNIAGLDAQGNPTNQIGYLAWSSNSATLYGSGAIEVDLLTVSASGVQVTTSIRTGNVFRIQYVGGVLYADSGCLYDSNSLAELGCLPAPNYPALAVTADAAVPRAYKITSTGGGGTELLLYDPATLAPQASANLLGVYIQYAVETSFTRWGPNGLAFLATDQQAAVGLPNDQVVLISGPFVTQ